MSEQDMPVFDKTPMALLFEPMPNIRPYELAQILKVVMGQIQLPGGEEELYRLGSNMKPATMRHFKILKQRQKNEADKQSSNRPGEGHQDSPGPVEKV